MAFLGHKNGPKLSEILIRNKSILLTSRKRRGSGATTPSKDTINNLIESERQEETQGLVVKPKIPKGPEVKPQEQFYSRFDSETNSGIEFYYILTKPEKERLESQPFSIKEVKVFSLGDSRQYESWREEMLGRGEFG